MKLTFKVTSRAILRSGEDIQGNQWTIHCEVGDLPHDVRTPLADRLFEDTFVCEGRLQRHRRRRTAPSASLESRFLLQVDGTNLQDLVKTIRQDQREVEESLAEARSEKNLTEA